MANRLNKEIPNSHILDQYSNPSNPLAHYDGTAEEIIEACDGAALVRGGPVTRCRQAGHACCHGRHGRHDCWHCPQDQAEDPDVQGAPLSEFAACTHVPQVVGVDPYGSILAQPDEINATDVTTYAVRQ